MKIIHISTIGRASNGIYFVLKNLIPEQQALGNEVQGYNVCRTGVHENNLQYLEYNGFRNILETNRPDIVIFHGIYYKEAIRFSRLLRKNKIPYLIELHGAQSKQNLKKSPIKKKLINYFFLNHVIKRANGVIYLNSSELNNSTVACLNKNNVIIPNGCHPRKLRFSDKKPESLELLFLGRLNIDHKGLDLMIPAVKKAYHYGLNIHLSIYGRGKDKEIHWLNEQLKGYEGIIDFFGEVFGQQKEKAFINSDVLLLTSRYEGFPMVILEAFSYGLPCIVTPETNVSEIIETDGSGLVAHGDVDSIAEAITAYYGCSDKEHREFSRNAIFSSQKFDWKKIGQKSVDIYSSLI